MNDHSTREAEAIGRQVKAALLHLRQAEDIAEAAGIDLDDYRDTGPAGLFRAAGEAVEDLDMWAIGNAREHGAVPAQTYEHTERWCHASGGQLPATSWPAEYEAAAGRGMLAPDAVATYAAMLEATQEAGAGREPDDDGRSVAEPGEPAGWQAEAESAVWGGREPSRSYAEWAAEGHQAEAEA